MSEPGALWKHAFQGQDWTTHFRDVYLNTMLPFLLVGLSLLVLGVKALLRRKLFDAQTDLEIEALDPWFNKSEEDDVTERVLRAENAMLIDATIAIHEREAHEKNALYGNQSTKKQRLEITCAVILLLTHVLGSFLASSAKWERGWLVFWAYGLAVSVYSYKTGVRAHISKHLVSITYMVVTVSNLRTAMLTSASQQVLLLTIVQLILALCMVGFSIFSPMTQRPPRKLRKLLEAMHTRGNPNYRNNVAQATSGAQNSPPCAYLQSSFASRCTRHFIKPFLKKHYKEPLTISGVPNIELGSCAAPAITMYRLKTNKKGAQAKKNGVASALWWRLLVNFVPAMTYQMACGVLETLLSLAPILFLQTILDFFTKRSNGEAPALHMGILYALLGFLSQVTFSFFQSQSLMAGRHIDIRIRAILTFEILSKALRRGLSLASIDKNSPIATDGQVTNLVSVDVNKIAEFSSQMHYLFPVHPLKIALSIAYLIHLLGKSAIVGVVLLIVAIPFQTFIARITGRVMARLLRTKDARLDLSCELLACMKTLKFYAWEKPFKERMANIRSSELQQLRQTFLLYAINRLTFVATPMLVILTTFGTHTLVFHEPLIASKVFTALALFNLLRNPLSDMPAKLLWFINSVVSMRRIVKFLDEPDTTKYMQFVTDETESQPKIIQIGFQDATFSYAQTAASQFQLRDLNCKFPTEKLSIVSGPVGSGKTSLLLALLGEMHRISGKTIMPCAIARSLVPHDPRTGLAETVAYCSQSPWLLGTTVRQNILFGAKYDEERYQQVLDACALGPDLEILEYHDETEVGEKGTALSGGQKARIALARAFYSNAKYLLVDDALSAVDAQTARHLAEKCFAGPLAKNRTIVLITHAMSLMLPFASYVVVMEKGRVACQDRPTALLINEQIVDSVVAQKLGLENTDPASAAHAKQSEDKAESMYEACEQGAKQARARKALADTNEENISRRESNTALYLVYMSAVSNNRTYAIAIWALLFCAYATIRGVDVGSGAWLRGWAGSYETNDTSVFATLHARMYAPAAVQNQVNCSEDTVRTLHFLKGYALFICAFIALSFFCDLVQFRTSLRASASLYTTLINSLLGARLQFYERTPIGRITNRLSHDVDEVDQALAPFIQMTCTYVLTLLATIIVICWATPQSLIVIALVFLLYCSIAKLYLGSARDLKRLESVQRSPLYTLLGESMAGTITIRAFGDAERVKLQCLGCLDKWNSAYIMLWYVNRWLCMYTDLIGASITLTASIFLLVGTADAPLAGFTLSYAINLLEVMLWVIRSYSFLSVSMNSVERIREYIDIPSERKGGKEPPAYWPTSTGSICVENLSVRYGPDTPMVLHNVSFTIRSGEKIGIVGRTGSGKSTLSLSFFRFLEAQNGSIVIDGIDISTIALESLRKRLTIIPQDAQLFHGTIRMNLDPFGLADDHSLWFALRCCQMARGTYEPSYVPDADSPVKSLEDPVEQSGANFSVGQRQLLSLARGMLKLRDSRILILDESTANLDAESDARIQKILRGEMAPGSTILTIAHRLKTIIDYDKVLVLDRGRIAEYDSPAKLLRDSTTMFYSLCQQSGDFDMLYSGTAQAVPKQAS
ncbi:hypothetical protein MVES1_000581 [Malassezia vespertilionis]|uniref:uncharacterized protein n=1 Tax=Malassezia vespertilionis TaxID=2020962 RepID=UPI0024B25BC1|nr:uncharacterized protein MVES1_000581 [Malassezia vespertilionis]WFD05253.1 hypothetical protein MVES1_000581 [Malassezia vespertilionis]